MFANTGTKVVSTDIYNRLVNAARDHREGIESALDHCVSHGGSAFEEDSLRGRLDRLDDLLKHA